MDKKGSFSTKKTVLLLVGLCIVLTLSLQTIGIVKIEALNFLPKSSDLEPYVRDFLENFQLPTIGVAYGYEQGATVNSAVVNDVPNVAFDIAKWIMDSLYGLMMIAAAFGAILGIAIDGFIARPAGWVLIFYAFIRYVVIAGLKRMFGRKQSQ